MWPNSDDSYGFIAGYQSLTLAGSNCGWIDDWLGDEGGESSADLKSVLFHGSVMRLRLINPREESGQLLSR